MTYVLLGLCLAFLAVIGYLAYALRGATKAERSAVSSEILASREQLKAERNQIEAERQRDAAIEKAGKAQASLTSALERLATAEQAANAARAELVKRVSAEVVTATPVQVLEIVNDLLGQPLLPPKET